MNTDTARRFNMLAAAVSALTAVLVMADCGGKDAPKTPAVDAQAETAPDTAAILVDSRDGKRYKIVTIGTQTWFARNLDYEAVGSVCYDNKPENCGRYGRLYTWDAAMKACPAGWHLPTDDEWKTLENAVGGSDVAGTKLKSTSGWNEGGNGTNDYGVSALPGGNGYSDGDFDGAGYYGGWWSATENNASYAWYRGMYFNYEGVSRYPHDKTYLFSVRCAQD